MQNKNESSIKVFQEDHRVLKIISAHTNIPQKHLLRQAVTILRENYKDLQKHLPAEVKQKVQAEK